MTESAPEPTELIYDEARRRLTVQEARIDDVRTRSLTVLGAAGVVMGLFGIPTFGSHPHGWHLGFAIAAVVMFVIVAATAVLVQWPFRIDQGDKLDEWLEKLRDPNQTAADFAHDMAHSFASAVATNADAYKRLVRCSMCAQIAFGVQVVTWTAVVV